MESLVDYYLKLRVGYNKKVKKRVMAHSDYHNILVGNPYVVDLCDARSPEKEDKKPAVAVSVAVKPSVRGKDEKKGFRKRRQRNIHVPFRFWQETIQLL